MGAYYVGRDSYKRNIWEIVGLREKIMETIFIENFKLYNFALKYFFDKTYRFREKSKKPKILTFDPE